MRAEAAVPFAVVRADYANLAVSFTLIAGTMSGALLLLIAAICPARQLPAFDLERAICHGETEALLPAGDQSRHRRARGLRGALPLGKAERRNRHRPAPSSTTPKSTGLAIPMTLSLMQQVRTDLGDLCRDMPDIKISINLFEGHFRDGSIVEDVQAIFGGSPISFRQLVFEITERRPLGNSEQPRMT